MRFLASMIKDAYKYHIISFVDNSSRQKKAFYSQGSKDKIKDKTMADKLMNIANDDSQNNLFCRLKSVVEIFEQSK